MKRKTLALLAVAALLAGAAACRRRPEPAAAEDQVFAPPEGRRAFSLSIDKSQTQFLSPGDVAEVQILVESPRADGTSETRSEVLAPRAEVLRVDNDWADDSGLVSLALTPEEVQYAALAVDREDRLFLNKLPESAKLSVWETPEKPTLAAGKRGLAVLVYGDQQEFLEPGDRVDVVATRQSAKATGKAELTAITLFQDVRVLGASPPEGNSDWATVQLELAPEQVPAMTRSIAAEDNLTLAARAPGDRKTRPVEPAKMSRRLSLEPGRASPKS